MAAFLCLCVIGRFTVETAILTAVGVLFVVLAYFVSSWLFARAGARRWKPADADAACILVWREYGQSLESLPRVFWVRVKSGYQKASLWGRADNPLKPVIIAGMAHFRANAINVVYPESGGKFSDSALAYELARMAQYNMGLRQYDEPGGDPGGFNILLARGTSALVSYERAKEDLERRRLQ